jgi:hypothetical protein
VGRGFYRGFCGFGGVWRGELLVSGGDSCGGRGN